MRSAIFAVVEAVVLMVEVRVFSVELKDEILSQIKNDQINRHKNTYFYNNNDVSTTMVVLFKLQISKFLKL